MTKEKRYCYLCGGDREYEILAAGESHVARGSSHVVARGSSHVVAWGSSHVVAWGSSHVVAWGSSHVEARESSHVVARELSHVEAWGSSHVEAWGSSHVVAWGSSHVVAWGSSHVVAWGSSHVEAWGSSHVVARESSHVVARKFNSVTIHGKKVSAKGGVQIRIPEIMTGKEWCDYYGVTVVKGVAILFKGVDDDYSTENARPRKIFYKPGTKPIAADWDGGREECGGGLHMCPTPLHTLQFNGAAKRFIACPVKLKQVKPYKNAQFPTKVKVETVCAPIYEVDRQGKRMG